MASQSTSSQPSSAPAGHSQAKRTPTDSSHVCKSFESCVRSVYSPSFPQYDFGGQPADKFDPNSPTWIYARDARAQQAGLGKNQKGTPHTLNQYPSRFTNQSQKPLPLTTPGKPRRPGSNIVDHLHHPLIPNTQKTYVNKLVSGFPGAVRSVYTEGKPEDFQVIYHDPKAGKTKSGMNDLFSVAPYVPAVPRPQPQPKTST